LWVELEARKTFLSKVIRGNISNASMSELFGQIPPLEREQDSGKLRLTDQLELLKEQAYQEGFQSGFLSGTQMGEAEGKRAGQATASAEAAAIRSQEAKLFFEDWEDLRTQFQTAVVEWFEDSEQRMTDLAMDVVRKILASELQLTSDSALNIARSVLSNVTHAKEARIRINSADLALFESHRDELLLISKDLTKFEIVQDPYVQSGVVIETQSGVLDATIETRLELIENEFTELASGQAA
jgi:flagellar assembly protein FliH